MAIDFCYYPFGNPFLGHDTAACFWIPAVEKTPEEQIADLKRKLEITTGERERFGWARDRAEKNLLAAHAERDKAVKDVAIMKTLADQRKNKIDHLAAVIAGLRSELGCTRSDRDDFRKECDEVRKQRDDAALGTFLKASWLGRAIKKAWILPRGHAVPFTFEGPLDVELSF
jgi:uncharacterized coiled-coil DUF342 family protein